MNNATSDIRIESIVAMQSPAELSADLPLPDEQALAITATRQRIADIIHGRDPRLLVVIGPCSIHDPVAAMDYAGQLNELRERYRDSLEIVMRVYFEKPRTIIGWKGLINDPNMDNSFQIDEGLYKARKLLLDLAAIGMPAGCEFLDAATGQYYADTVSWGAIGARTTESQVHREIASGLSCPVGFKNATSGDVGIAIDAIQAASHPHAFLSPTSEGRIALFRTRGNEDAHLILRGGKTPNFDTASVKAASDSQQQRGISPRIMIDCSHGNSLKDHKRQRLVAADIAARLPAESSLIAGLMIESHLVEGKQSMAPPAELTYGQSITDACMGWQDTDETLSMLASAMQQAIFGKPFTST
ncbi:3-deoxy-7-phosphoheptulonate synthase [Granulosicoccus sp. 3-233]|uniref:3-deoxy-7-phosphoheptulonate synthase n=1 Tax=Granulosicoccus sp. 3-233 TaxID=3417969 RepID=UPI003D32BC6D